MPKNKKNAIKTFELGDMVYGQNEANESKSDLEKTIYNEDGTKEFTAHNKVNRATRMDNSSHALKYVEIDLSEEKFDGL